MRSTSWRGLRNTVLAATLAIAVGGLGAVGANAAGSATSSTGAIVIANAFSLPDGAVVNGLLPFTTPMHVEVALKLRNRDQLDRFIAGGPSPVSGSAHAPLSGADILANYSPTVEQAQAVVDFLTGAGFSNVTVAPNRLLVSADATADVVQAAFQTSFAQVATADGRTDAYANTSPVSIPANLQPIVLSVVGLQTAVIPHTMVTAADMVDAPDAVTGHYPTEFSSIYGGNGVATAAGVTVGIFTNGNLNQTISDLNTFTSQQGLPTVSTLTVNTNGTSNDTSGTPEWDLDSQDIVGMGGGQVGQLIFYNVPTLSNSNMIANFNTIVSRNEAKIINVSLGECEKSANSDGSVAAADQILAVADAQGQTFSISTGDSGANECGSQGPGASWPAMSQYVIAASGTTLDASTTTWNNETVWASSGGSASVIEPKPSWQTLYNGPTRGVADIAFDGNPSSGSKIIVNGSLAQYGGTSLSAPIFAGSWARVIATKGTGVGFAGPLVYQLPAADFHDVVSGSNGGSTAGPGYDLASGRGSMILAQAINDLGGGGGGNNPPVASFTYTISGLTVNFTDTSTDSDGSIVSRSWNFGDGGTSTATNPSHTYASSGSYTVSLTVTDNDNATGSTSHVVTVSSGGGGGGTVLQNNVPVTGLSAARHKWTATYTLAVPAGASNLTFTMSGGTGDADLYVRFGSAPTLRRYSCRPYLVGNNETCSFPTPSTGTYYVKIYAYSAFSGVTLLPSYTP